MSQALFLKHFIFGILLTFIYKWKTKDFDEFKKVWEGLIENYFVNSENKDDNMTEAEFIRNHLKSYLLFIPVSELKDKYKKLVNF